MDLRYAIGQRRFLLGRTTSHKLSRVHHLFWISHCWAVIVWWLRIEGLRSYNWMGRTECNQVWIISLCSFPYMAPFLYVLLWSIKSFSLLSFDLNCTALPPLYLARSGVQSLVLFLGVSECKHSNVWVNWSDLGAVLLLYHTDEIRSYHRVYTVSVIIILWFFYRKCCCE